MTAVCAGGSTATPNAAFGSATFISPAALGAKFANTASWASVFIAAFIGAVSYDLSTFCPGGPPTIPTLTSDDFKALLVPQLDLQAFNVARKRLQDWVGGMVWYDLCDCPGGLAGSVPTPQSQPTGMPTFNPPAFPFPTVAPCKRIDTVFANITGTQSFSRGGINTNGVTGSWIKWQVFNTVVSGGGVSVRFDINQQGGSPLTNQRVDSVTVGPGGTATRLIPYFGPTITNIDLDATALGGAGVSSEDIIAEVYCNGDYPGEAQSPCCPPDPSIQGKIDELMSMVTLIQRQLVPFAYIAGSVHSGLTDSGSFAIQGILGAKIDITTMPSALGRSGLSPEEFFDVGYVTFNVADGYPHSVRIEHDPHVVFPARCSVFTELSYDLHPGVVATITELKREP